MKAADTPGHAPNPESEDIAKLLRALNEDLKADPIDVAELDEDDEDAQPSRGLPLGKIAAALLAAAGIGVAVVMLDPGGGTPSSNSADTAAPLVPPAPAITRAPPPANPAQPAPESMIARAPAPAPALPPAAATLPSSAPPPPPAVASPLNPPPALRVPEPPALPPTASAPRPAPVARTPEAPPPAPVAQAEAPKAETAPPPPPTAPKAADAGELQAMLAPPREPRDAKRAPAKPAEAKAAESKPTAAPRPASAAPTTAPAPAAANPGGRYAVQIGTFKVAENAESLTRRLKSGGFPAYTLEWTDQSNQSWRAVRVGGYADAEAARRAVSQLKAKMGVNSVVVTTR